MVLNMEMLKHYTERETLKDGPQCERSEHGRHRKMSTRRSNVKCQQDGRQREMLKDALRS